MADPIVPQVILPNPITKVTQQIDGKEYVGYLGISDDKNVKIKTGNNSYITLFDFYQNFNGFKQTANFIRWEDRPNSVVQDPSNPNVTSLVYRDAADDQIKIWYETEY